MAPSMLVLSSIEPIQEEIRDSSRQNEGSLVVRPSATFHRSLHGEPPQVTSAQGQYLFLDNDQSILDATGGAAVACLGHGNERIRKALIEQMLLVSYCHSLFFATKPVEDLSRFLIDSTYGEMARAFMVSSGSEAMEAALKLARQYHLEKVPSEPCRTHIISRRQSYHGATLGALSVSGHKARRLLFEPMLSTNSSSVSPCYAYRGQTADMSDEDYVRHLEAELEAEFQRVGPHNVSAVVAEPVVGAALGCVPPVAGYFQAVRRVCDRHGALLILDEVMSGSGRVGPEPSVRYPEPLHAWQDALIGVVPDIMTLGKGLGGGYQPIAAMLASKRVVKALGEGSGGFGHGQTYQGHPVACAAALEVQRVIREANLMANVRKQGALLGRLLGKKLAHHPAIGSIRGKGLFWGIEFVANKATKEPFPPAQNIACRIQELGMQRPFNISLYPGTGTVDGTRGDHILLAPAYTSTAEDIEKIVRTTADVIDTFFGIGERATDPICIKL